MSNAKSPVLAAASKSSLGITYHASLRKSKPSANVLRSLTCCSIKLTSGTLNSLRRLTTISVALQPAGISSLSVQGPWLVLTPALNCPLFCTSTIRAHLYSEVLSGFTHLIKLFCLNVSVSPSILLINTLRAPVENCSVI